VSARPARVVTAHLNGRAATIDDLAPLAFAGYAHYTSMQVRGWAVRGLDLHLDRLERSSATLFGRATAGPRVRDLLAGALLASGLADASTVVTVFSRDAAAVLRGDAVEPDVLVRVSDPVAPSAEPITLRTVRYARSWPEIKHADTLALTLHPRRVAAEGRDDVLFVGDDDRVSEGSVWNVAFMRGRSVVLPDAPMLPGITLQLATAGLRQLDVDVRVAPVRVDELGTFSAAAAMNSIDPARRIARIDACDYEDDGSLHSLLREAVDTQPLQRIS
jgi:branched-subunit amino acid aminotransferase/4-amino-4-deoxychorismate lyase